jgi:excisionase family DNA binding protein
VVLTETPATDAPSLKKAFYSPTEVAALASVSSSAVLNYIHVGKLAAVRLSERKYRIPRKSVILLLGLEAPPVQIFRDPDAKVDLSPKAARQLDRR